MISEEELKNYLQQNLKPRRYEHSLGVMKTAMEIAKRYGVDEEKAKIAGLIHDCAKNIENEELVKYAQIYNIPLDDILISQPALLHGPVGAYIAREKFDIHDDEIFDAIYYHTLGNKNMSMLVKIIYIADYIEPSRNFLGVKELRIETFKDIDRAIINAFDNTIKFILSKGNLIHYKTIEARNNMILKVKR